VVDGVPPTDGVGEDDTPTTTGGSREVCDMNREDVEQLMSRMVYSSDTKSEPAIFDGITELGAENEAARPHPPDAPGNPCPPIVVTKPVLTDTARTALLPVSATKRNGDPPHTA